MPIPIHLETELSAPPARVFDVLTDSEKFSDATGKPARIGASEGAAFSIFGGYIEGRQIELVPGERIVQAWRLSDWAPGVYSLAKLTFTREGKGTRLEVDHDAYPEGESPFYPTWHEHLATGWPMFYFDSLANYLAD